MRVTEATFDRSTLTIPDTPPGMIFKVTVPTLGDQFTLEPGQSLKEMYDRREGMRRMMSDD